MFCQRLLDAGVCNRGIATHSCRGNYRDARQMRVETYPASGTEECMQ